jgi:hypothetical protein
MSPPTQKRYSSRAVVSRRLMLRAQETLRADVLEQRFA